MKTKSKISGHIIRGGAWAVILSVAFIAATSAFDSPNKWYKSAWRLSAMAALRKVRANPERSASQSAWRTNEQLKTFTGVTGFGERRARHAKLDAITARLLEVDRQTRVAGVTPSVAAEEGSESPGHLVLDDV